MFKRDVCACLNGGKCIEHVISFCECPVGFQGSRCEEVYFEFVEKKTDNDFNLMVVLVVVLVGLLLTTVFCFFTCKKIKTIRDRQIERANLRNRRQSRVTIEGFSMSGRETDNERVEHAQYQLEIFEKSTKYSFNNATKTQDCRNLTQTKLIINEEKITFI